MKKTRLCDLLGIDYPVIQAPMNLITGAELASAVSNAGGLGVIGPNAGAREETNDVVETGERLRQQIRKTKSLTNKTFGVNLMCASTDLRPDSKPFSDQCTKVVVEEGVPVAVLAGDEPERYVKQLKGAGIKVLHRALPVNVEIAKRAEQSGIDAFIAVGFEGGGHTGFHRVPTFVLVPQVVDALQIPVIAGGGIVNGRSMAAALALGAEGVYIGTGFIVATECPAHQNVKWAIISASDTSTTTIAGLGGIVLRALKTPLIERCIQMEANGNATEEITKLYRSGYRKGMLEGDRERGTFIFGAGAGSIQELKSAGEIVKNIIEETEQILQTL
ncbi:MAG TPA: enoyl-[acyl-carrier-protein] reductase FabK [Dehalococcoidia bacterium]|nr:enoyl-[acyl-carrier-protein] reductase FabK [Dehalococcoidia bacterium]